MNCNRYISFLVLAEKQLLSESFSICHYFCCYFWTCCKKPKWIFTIKVKVEFHFSPLKNVRLLMCCIIVFYVRVNPFPIRRSFQSNFQIKMQFPLLFPYPLTHLIHTSAFENTIIRLINEIGQFSQVWYAYFVMLNYLEAIDGFKLLPWASMHWTWNSV